MTPPVTVTVPGVKVTSEANSRGAWQKKYRRTKQQRATVGKALLVLVPKGRRQALSAAPRLRVTLTRIYCGRARAFDELGNLETALKACRDEVAAWLGRSDAPGSGIEWPCLQRKGDLDAVEIRIEEVTA